MRIRLLHYKLINSKELRRFSYQDLIKIVLIDP